MVTQAAQSSHGGPAPPRPAGRRPRRSSPLGAGAVAEELGEKLPGAGLAAHHRFALPHLREGSARAHSELAPTTSRFCASSQVGEIKATILERDGKILIEKTCPTHGTFTDTLAIDPAFQERIEGLFPGRDLPAVTDTLHNHGTSSIKYGRGSVLTIDLTNRCNMMCDPCFMDANQVGYVHELSLDEVKQLLDDAITIKPKRQMSVQFSGGEPTLSPIFLESVAYARQVGYYSVQAATNGIRFAQDPDFAIKAREAGLRIAYLQFDGIGEDANGHRKVGNLFDVKLHAIENLSPCRHRHRPRCDDRQHDQQRPGRADHQVRRRELREDQLRLLSAGVVHGS